MAAEEEVVAAGEAVSEEMLGMVGEAGDAGAAVATLEDLEEEKKAFRAA